MWNGGFMEKIELTALSDAGPVIHLDELGCLELLADFEEIIIPPSVWTEVDFHRPGLFSSELNLTRYPAIIEDNGALRTLFSLFNLHQGEQESILIASRMPGILFLTDDAAARLAATQLGIKVHGTIGILLRSVRRMQKTRAQVADILSSIPQKSTLHIRQNLLAEIISSLQVCESSD
jgi:predicted nucleic acid-binding protein